VAKLTRFLAGDRVVHKSNRDITWLVTERDIGENYACTTVLPVNGVGLVHSVLFHEDELDRSIP
jgi:hypothetical protein